MHKKLMSKFKLLVLEFVEELSSFRTLNLENVFGEPLKVLHTVRACKTTYATIKRYHIRLLYNVTILYAYKNVTIYVRLTLRIFTLTIYACYNGTIRYSVTLLMTIFDALSIAVGVLYFHAMFSKLIQDLKIK